MTEEKIVGLRTKIEIDNELRIKGFTPGIIIFKHDKEQEPNCLLCNVSVNNNNWGVVLKELMDPDINGINQEVMAPICDKCRRFRADFDYHFREMCTNLKLFELYRTTTRNKQMFFPSQIIFNVDREVLLELYLELLGVCYEAWKESNDDEWRKNYMDELNYYWRKRDA